MFSLRLRVLVVDDTPIVRAVVRRTLEADGRFDVVAEAPNGRDAIGHAARCDPDLVLLDLAMPVMDGLEALPRILEVAPRSQVIVLSAFSADQMAAQALRAGACAYLEKTHLAKELIPGIVSSMEERVIEVGGTSDHAPFHA
ncbi:MAG TPA: response regulator [Acidimicrobiales bacterium]|nr:response regulator [Acidimicrobiales bacterium]